MEKEENIQKFLERKISEKDLYREIYSKEEKFNIPVLSFNIDPETGQAVVVEDDYYKTFKKSIQDNSNASFQIKINNGQHYLSLNIKKSSNALNVIIVNNSPSDEFKKWTTAIAENIAQSYPEKVNVNYYNPEKLQAFYEPEIDFFDEDLKPKLEDGKIKLSEERRIEGFCGKVSKLNAKCIDSMSDIKDLTILLSKTTSIKKSQARDSR